MYFTDLESHLLEGVFSVAMGPMIVFLSLSWLLGLLGGTDSLVKLVLFILGDSPFG